jgi:hypothetical protein
MLNRSLRRYFLSEDCSLSIGAATRHPSKLIAPKREGIPRSPNDAACAAITICPGQTQRLWSRIGSDALQHMDSRPTAAQVRARARASPSVDQMADDVLRLMAASAGRTNQLKDLKRRGVFLCAY